MVMDATPSPQNVGREFVRQYYTLLNKAPDHLHRFYNNYSSFVHGGLDAPNRETLPVIGQKQIHNRIQQLNFRDCHAKISQVDAQATLGNGVVVQVTGELSNGGAPMRRFTQTFVLAAQSPKKYYVHNDIFRYQDIVVSDEEGSVEARSEAEEDEARGGYYAGAGGAGGAAPAFPPFPPPPELNGHPDEPAPPAPAPAPAPAAPEPTPQRRTEHIAPPPQHVSAPLAAAPAEPEPAEEPELPREPTPPPVVRAASPARAPEPKTYANLLKAARAAAAPPPPAPMVHNNQSSVPPMESRARAPRPRDVSYHHTSESSSYGGGNGGGNNSVGAGGGGGAGAGAAGAAGAGAGSAGVGAGAGGAPLAGRRYSDAQQLFLGNIPHCATEDALKSLFSRFGMVAELRVHGKANMGPGAPPLVPGRHPNYGFITYETAHAAKECLANQPLYLDVPGEGPVKLNVEEKKARREPRRLPSGTRAFPRYRR